MAKTQGRFDITVRKIANGWIISYPVPHKKTMEEAVIEPQDPFEAAFSGRRPQPTTDICEWYCSTKAVVEQVLPKLVMESYHGQINLKE